MVAKGTKEKFIELARLKHGDQYNYDEVVYVNNKTLVKIWCNKHKEYFYQQPNNHLYGNGGVGHKCPKCGQEDTAKNQSKGKDQFIKDAKAKHGGKYTYDKVVYVNNTTDVIIYCIEHKKYFKQKPKDHLNPKNGGCKQCGIEARSASRSLGIKKFIELSIEKHGDIFDYSQAKYINNHTKIIIKCKICKSTFPRMPMQHVRGDPCPKKCADKKCSHNNAKKTTEEFIAQCKEKHKDEDYDYSKTKYINDRTDVIIICKDHGEFHIKPNYFLRKGKCSGCNKKVHKYTTEQFIERAKKVHGNKYNYSKVDYEDNQTDVLIICPKPGHGEFLQRPCVHIDGKCKCPTCAYEELSITNAMTKEEFIKRANIVHNNKYGYPKVIYKNNYTEIIINCPEHGDFPQIPTTHLSGCGCPAHGKEEQRKKLQMTKEEFIRRANAVHHGKYNYSEVEYINNHTDVKIYCEEHGYFYQTPAAHIHRGDCCPKCSNRGYSRKAIAWLNYISYVEGINIQHAENGGEYKIPDTNYTVDGYCSTTKTVYEFHGCYFHGCLHCHEPDETVNKKSCLKLFESTTGREDAIESKGYKLVTIWEHEWDLIQDAPIVQQYYDRLELLIDLAIEILSMKNVPNKKEIEYKIYTGSIMQIRQINRLLLKDLISDKPKKIVNKKQIIEV